MTLYLYDYADGGADQLAIVTQTGLGTVASILDDPQVGACSGWAEVAAD